MMEPGTAQRPAVPSAEVLERILRYSFGIQSFRPRQLEAIQATLAGRDSLVILPTGAGKSLCFQVPPHLQEHSVTVVVSPLIALAKDQVDKAAERGLEAQAWNSDVPEARREALARELAGGEPTVKLLYATPEALLTPLLRDALKEAHRQGVLCSFAIDEAHCVSSWGHDFRPSYLQLASLRDDFPGTPIACYTASCTSEVRQSIAECLHLSRDCALILASFNRHNIEYAVRHKELLGDGTDAAALLDLAAFMKARPGQCGIIYARLRVTCDWLVSQLCEHGLECEAFHAGKESRQRSRVQGNWSEGATDVVVATIAFGMGIDKADVRWVCHWNAPGSMEGLYQESGRAGRDGLPSVSLVYSSLTDLEAMRKMERGSRAGSVASVDQYARGPGCKRRKVLAFFGEKRGGCDISAGEACCDWCVDSAATSALLARLDKVDEKRSLAAAVAAVAASQQQAAQPNLGSLVAAGTAAWSSAAALKPVQPVQWAPPLGQSIPQAVPQIKKRRPSGSTINGAFLPPRPKQQCVAAKAATATAAATACMGATSEFAGGSTAADEGAQEKENPGVHHSEPEHALAGAHPGAAQCRPAASLSGAGVVRRGRGAFVSPLRPR